MRAGPRVGACAGALPMLRLWWQRWRPDGWNSGARHRYCCNCTGCITCRHRRRTFSYRFLRLWHLAWSAMSRPFLGEFSRRHRVDPRGPMACGAGAGHVRDTGILPRDHAAGVVARASRDCQHVGRVVQGDIARVDACGGRSHVSGAGIADTELSNPGSAQRAGGVLSGAGLSASQDSATGCIAVSRSGNEPAMEQQLQAILSSARQRRTGTGQDRGCPPPLPDRRRGVARRLADRARERSRLHHRPQRVREIDAASLCQWSGTDRSRTHRVRRP